MYQCPSSGFFHFYVERLRELFKKNAGVNALRRADFISTKTGEGELLLKSGVSMPYVGLPSFLQKVLRKYGKMGSVCQCPMSGFFHFYFPNKITIR